MGTGLTTPGDIIPLTLDSAFVAGPGCLVEVVSEVLDSITRIAGFVEPLPSTV
jgi:hypothetical protein